MLFCKASSHKGCGQSGMDSRKGENFMASFNKYKEDSVDKLLRHNNRTPDDGVEHSNQEIDGAKTMYNYHFKKGTTADVRKKLSEIFMIPSSRLNVLGEMIVTIPEDVKSEDEREFFRSVYDFYCADFGEENIINAVVHKDEIRPHIHIDFIPVVEEEKEYLSRGRRQAEEWRQAHPDEPFRHLCCSELIDREYLEAMHTRLSDYVAEKLGYEVSILNGATANGNRTVQELKLQSLQKEIADMEKRRETLQQEIVRMHTFAEKWGIGEFDIGLLPLMYRIDDLETQNHVLQEILTRNGYTYSRKDLELMRKKKFIPAKSAYVNVCTGTLCQAEIEQRAVIVVELEDKEQRLSPQDELLKKDYDMFKQAGFARKGDKKVSVQKSRNGDKLYIFIKADNEMQTVENLLEFERILRETDLEGRKVYMDRMEMDTLDVAYSVLQKNKIEALYFTRQGVEDKTESKEQELSKN